MPQSPKQHIIKKTDIKSESLAELLAELKDREI